MTSAGSWGDVIEEAETERFIGREQELDALSKEISLARPRYLVFYIMGQGGVGKTTLLNRFRKTAQDAGFLLADSDEQQRDVPTVLGRFARQLVAQGHSLKRFDEQYKLYRQKMDEIENDPQAPQGLAAMLGRTVIRATYIVGDIVPGLRKGLEYLPREALETQASEWAEYLAKKLSTKDEVALVREPVSILTPLFFEGLNEVAQKWRVLLCFENFEATRQELQDWLQRLREYNPSQNIRIAIAGRDQPGAQWEVLRKVTMVVHLDVFTEQEAAAFLDTYGINDLKRRKEILEWSDRLPVLMSWLAAPEGEEPDPSVPTHSIVERFLRWVTEPGLRQVALLAAIPRTFNVDILKLLLENDDQGIDVMNAFDWLLTMPFVQQHSVGWRYHDVVRRMMLDDQRLKTPQTYRQAHAVLSDYYATKRLELSSSGEELWTGEQWRKDTLAYIYHFLVTNPNKNWGEVMRLFALAMRKRRAFATEIIESLNLEDVRNELSSEQDNIVQLFRQQLFAIENGDLQDGFDMFDRLCAIPGLSSQARGYALAYRGESYRLKDKSENALSDFDNALYFIPEDAWAFAHRGETYQGMERYEEALADFDQAIALDEKMAWAISSRGETYQGMERYEEALADFDRAIALDEKDAWAIGGRGETYRLMKRYEEALADFDRAIALDEKDAWAIGSRGLTYRLMERYEEALADFDRAIALDEKMALAIDSRGETYRLMERYEEALADFDRAIALDEKNAWAIGSRGQTYQGMKRYEEALADFDRAIALDEKMAWAIDSRGETYQGMKRYEEALADFDRAIALDEKMDWAFDSRGETYQAMERYEEALTDFDRAIALDEKYAWAFAHRGETYQAMERYEEALTDFDRAIALDEKYAWAFAHRGETYQAMERYEEALTDFDRAIALNEKNDWYWYRRAQIHLLTDDESAFLSDMDIAIKLAQASLDDASSIEYWRIGFNLALYTLVSGDTTNAELQYDQLASACVLMQALRAAENDLKDLLRIQPTNGLAQHIRTKLLIRITELTP